MPVATNQIIGGGFQYPDGTPVANGNLVMQLCGDLQAPAVGEVVSGKKITVPLDSSGNVLGTVHVWPNDVLIPTGSCYTVWVYASNGELVYGPEYQQVLQTPSPYNLNAWIPGGCGCGGGTGSGGADEIFQVNGVNNVVQTLLNLSQGTNMTITDQGNGTVTFDATGGAGGTPALPFTSVQFNNSGAFGGSANFTWNGTSATVGQNTNPNYTVLNQGLIQLFQTENLSLSTQDLIDVVINYTGTVDPNFANPISVTLDPFGALNFHTAASTTSTTSISAMQGSFLNYGASPGGGDGKGLTINSVPKGSTNAAYGIDVTVDDSFTTLGGHTGEVGIRAQVANNQPSGSSNITGLLVNLTTNQTVNPSTMSGIVVNVPTGAPCINSSGHALFGGGSFVNLPAPGVAIGSIAYIVDSPVNTWGTAVTTGGGTHHVMVFSNGTNWTVMAA